VKENERCTFELSERASDTLSICGALMFGERFVLVFVPYDPSPRRVRFNVDG
jgi:hypothetical protein